MRTAVQPGPPYPPPYPRPYAWAPPRRPAVNPAVLVVVIFLVFFAVFGIVFMLAFSGFGGFFPFSLLAPFCSFFLFFILILIAVATSASKRPASLPPPPPIQQPMVPAGMAGPIALNCPNCGAPPEAIDRFGVATCTHCATRFLVR